MVEARAPRLRSREGRESQEAPRRKDRGCSSPVALRTQAFARLARTVPPCHWSCLSSSTEGVVGAGGPGSALSRCEPRPDRNRHSALLRGGAHPARADGSEPRPVILTSLSRAVGVPPWRVQLLRAVAFAEQPRSLHPDSKPGAPKKSKLKTRLEGVVAGAGRKAVPLLLQGIDMRECGTCELIDADPSVCKHTVFLTDVAAARLPAGASRNLLAPLGMHGIFDRSHYEDVLTDLVSLDVINSCRACTYGRQRHRQRHRHRPQDEDDDIDERPPWPSAPDMFEAARATRDVGHRCLRPKKAPGCRSCSATTGAAPHQGAPRPTQRLLHLVRNELRRDSRNAVSRTQEVPASAPGVTWRPDVDDP